MFYQNLIRLCTERGTTPTEVCHSIGLASSAATKWKSGAIPRDTTLKKIADYFGVSVGFLLGEEAKEKEPTKSASPAITLTPEEQLVALRYRSINPNTQAIIRKILDIPTGDEELIPVYHAAHSKDGTAEDKIIYRTREEVERLENAPESDLDI